MVTHQAGALPKQRACEGRVEYNQSIAKGRIMLSQEAANEVQKEWAAIQASDVPQEVKRFAFRMMNAALAWRYDVQNLIFQIDEEALRSAEAPGIGRHRRGVYRILGVNRKGSMMDTREPKVLDKGEFWLICLPMYNPEPGREWAGFAWHKQQAIPLTGFAPMTLAELEREAEQTMTPPAED